jgi:hypothetical protein
MPDARSARLQKSRMRPSFCKRFLQRKIPYKRQFCSMNAKVRNFALLGVAAAALRKVTIRTPRRRHNVIVSCKRGPSWSFRLFAAENHYVQYGMRIIKRLGVIFHATNRVSNAGDRHCMQYIVWPARLSFAGIYWANRLNGSPSNPMSCRQNIAHNTLE